MRLFRDLSHIGLSRGSVVTIGNFDGLHRGHQALMNQCVHLGGDRLDRAVVSFEPLPREWFDPDTAPARLYGVREKLLGLAGAGMDLAWLMRFNDRLAQWPAEEFVRRVLVDGLRARHVVVGDDFRFGHRRQGDGALMKDMGVTHGFSVFEMPTVEHAGKRVSSSAIRAALGAGDLRQAAQMLGRAYRMSGHVVGGRRLGRELGYPTANVRPPSAKVALSGVFAVRARIEKGDWRPGVASLGCRPVVDGRDMLLEVHLFDFEGDLYGRRLETEFVEKLRDESNFDELGALVAQMRADEHRARDVLADIEG